MSGKLRLIATLALRGALEGDILPRLRSEAGMEVEAEWAPTTVILSRLAGGAAADVIVLVTDSIDLMAEQGKLAPASRVELVHSRIGLAVAPGAVHPDVSSVEAFTAALLAARSVAYSQSGASGLYFQQLIRRLGIADAINACATVVPAGFTAETLLTGQADLAVQQVSELLMVPNVELVGHFPAAVQQVTSFSAAVLCDSQDRPAAARLLAGLTDQRAAAAYRASGLDPVRRATL